MVSFDVTSSYTNIVSCNLDRTHITVTLDFITDYVNNDDQITKKMIIPQDKFLELVSLVLTTTWYTSNFKFYQQTDGVVMGGPESLTTPKIYLKAHELTAIFTVLKIWE